LDYIPHLRNIACTEFIADKNYAALKLDEETYNEFQRKRPRTRRTAPKGRIHYFDLVIGTSRYGSDDSEGKAIGEELATMKLRFNSNN